MNTNIRVPQQKIKGYCIRQIQYEIKKSVDTATENECLLSCKIEYCKIRQCSESSVNSKCNLTIWPKC